MKKDDAIPGGGGGVWEAHGKPKDEKWVKQKSTDVSALAQIDMFGEAQHQKSQGSILGDEFLLPPFSVLNAREGWWQDRKRAWLALGIKSELGRGELAIDPGQSAPARTDQAAAAMKSYLGRPKNLLGRSIHELVACACNLNYNQVRDFVAEKRKLGLDDAAILAEASRLSGRNKVKGGAARTFGQDLMRGEHVVGEHRQTASLNGGTTFRIPGGAYRDPDGETTAAQSGTSIFDPVLCECAYRWFAPPGGVVLDPFAGGSVRGIVASHLGLKYVGVELREEQVAANREQGGIARDPQPEWRQGDSRQMRLICDDIAADFVFSCPPYADLEVYSTLKEDISTLQYSEFIKAYREIIAATCFRLKRNAFAAFVVGEVRGPHGGYYGFVGDTVRAFQDAGMHFWNECILVTAAGSLALRAGKQFRASRALGKSHQQMLVFVKGDPKEAAGYLAHKDKEWTS